MSNKNVILIDFLQYKFIYIYIISKTHFLRIVIYVSRNSLYLIIARDKHKQLYVRNKIEQQSGSEQLISNKLAQKEYTVFFFYFFEWLC